MSEIRCFHCSQSYDEQLNHCPYCHAPSPAQQDRNLEQRKHKFVYFFIGLVIFCGFMMIWLPRIMRQ
ncbi:MAG: hypothetical protein HOM14_02380 [Gammaproteobacteria bacterium]|nr:hypothetical protein [Gammaproteobacteria bacterium]MBT3724740.1 hypothetical protein [Gammaproteobacteria bacterium]MBT4078940.1 hypothetical protein [Gammaproteobacteria bacterium]MBT4195511.1 hypothetical protein [Gammaproteobacteria bacterium]MBT4448767.1 hypothetical protein [Gammaproteobacteria bacterium]